MIRMSLHKCTKLLEIEDWDLTEPQKRFLMGSTTDLVEHQGKDWIRENRDRLILELSLIFKEIGPPIDPDKIKLWDETTKIRGL